MDYAVAAVSRDSAGVWCFQPNSHPLSVTCRLQHFSSVWNEHVNALHFESTSNLFMFAFFEKDVTIVNEF